MNILILILILIFILILILYFTYEGKYNTKYKPSLKDDGFIFLNSQNKDNVLRHLPKGYQFINYKYTIHGCTLSTFHRDVTSSQYIYKTKYPTYTFITYKHKGSGLSVCPGSHKTTPLLFTHPINVNSKNILFNCDLVHAGSLNLNNLPRTAIQYKIVHKEDLKIMKHLNGINKEKKGDCNKRNNILIDIFYRKCSLLFCYFINHQLTPYLQSRKGNILCKLIGEERCFYNK